MSTLNDLYKKKKKKKKYGMNHSPKALTDTHVFTMEYKLRKLTTITHPNEGTMFFCIYLQASAINRLLNDC